MKHRILRICVGAALASICIGGCKRSDSASAGQGRAAGDQTRPNIVLITLCSFRFSHMPVAGYDRPTTPFLDSLATGGVLFDRASSSSSWTKPSVASILTGLTPNVHTLTDMCGDRQIIGGQFSPQRILGDDIVTLAECLRDVGYATAARINNVQAGEFFNLTQGFDDAVTSHDLDTPGMLDEFAAWLRTLSPDKPFLFFMLTRDAHIPYDPQHEYYLKFNRSAQAVPPERFRGYCHWLRQQVERRVEQRRPVHPGLRQKWVDLYDAELAQLDDALSRLPALLDETGRRAETLIVVIADHGERFFERGRIGHSRIPDESVVHVPLIFSGLNVPAGRRLHPVVRSIDVYPTLAELAGADVPDVLQGTSLLPIVYGDPEQFPTLTAFSSYKDVHHAVRDGDLKLHLWGDGRRSLHDLEADPRELQDVWAERPDEAMRLDGLLCQWLDEEDALRQLVAHPDTRELTPEVIEQLRSLGYLR